MSKAVSQEEQVPAIRLQHITKRFGSVVANDDVSLSVAHGQILSVLGENGSGKTTLMNMIAGIYFPDHGQIFVDGKEVLIRSPKDAFRYGIGMIHQHFKLVDVFSATENIVLGLDEAERFSLKRSAGRVREITAQYGFELDPDKKIYEMSVSEKQTVEIIKVLYRGADILILDEPTAVLTPQETQKLFAVLRRMRDSGKAIIIITHKLNEVSYVADKITVIRDGSTIETIDNHGKEPVSEERIIKGMVGREITNRFPKRENVKIGDIRMEVSHWTAHHPLYPEKKVVDDVSLYVRQGEVVGIYGLMGAGRTELAMSIFGQSYGVNFSGELKLDGKPVKMRKSESDAIRHKIAYVTEDRKGNGLVLSQSIKVNTSLANLGAISNHMVIDGDKEYAVAEEYRDKLKIKTPSVEQLVGNLSGGNQQKVLLAKWMFAEPDILLLDEPTRGIDVGAKYEIYCIINDLAAAGKCVVLISSELPEVLGMSDRIYIMNEARIVGEMKAEDATQENIMATILRSGRGV